jgi:hypothetical protein
MKDMKGIGNVQKRGMNGERGRKKDAFIWKDRGTSALIEGTGSRFELSIPRIQRRLGHNHY